MTVIRLDIPGIDPEKDVKVKYEGGVLEIVFSAPKAAPSTHGKEIPIKIGKVRLGKAS